ncbi:uncharacterized protein LOC125056132 [Pieris napi]|uniref:uncharacterized protein LOC125056132 n=1 Tax=Pieris napi TaxID=78633 RepID=UPI001FB97992|nr:uncharacterized protein LOC125056132 [Pieris napi]
MDFYRIAEVITSTMLHRTVIFGLVLCFSMCIAFQISAYESSSGADENKSWIRHRREIEDLSEEFPPPVKAQEEPGFWERVMNVAIRIFNKFIEWLNT